MNIHEGENALHKGKHKYDSLLLQWTFCHIWGKKRASVSGRSGIRQGKEVESGSSQTPWGHVKSVDFGHLDQHCDLTSSVPLTALL
jgi:hypothetical protein